MMTTRIEKTRTRGRGRTRGYPAAWEIEERFEDCPDLDPECVEMLLNELADDDTRLGTATNSTSASDPERPANQDIHDDDSDPEEEPEPSLPSLPGMELADTWMLKSGKTPLLTPAQEIVLAKRVERGDHKAKEELLNANVRLVASVARRYLGRGLPLEDLMQEGLLGLLRAIEKYNYRKGYRFSTYATFWIRQAVTRAIANQGRSIRLPAHVVDAIGRIVRIREELFQRLGRPPTRQEVAEAAGISEKKLVQLLRNAAQPISLETPVGAEGEARLGEFIRGDEEESPSDRVFRYLVRDELEQALNILNPREKEVLALRYGLGGEDPHTLEETGRRLHITRERARQIEAKALEKLRRPHAVDRLKEAVG